MWPCRRTSRAAVLTMPDKDPRYGIMIGAGTAEPWQRDCVAGMISRFGVPPRLVLTTSTSSEKATLDLPGCEDACLGSVSPGHAANDQLGCRPIGSTLETLDWILVLDLDRDLAETAHALRCPLRGFLMRPDPDNPGLAQIVLVETATATGSCRVLRQGRWQRSRRTAKAFLSVITFTLGRWPSRTTDHEDPSAITTDHGWTTIGEGISVNTTARRGLLKRLRSRLWRDRWEMGLVKGPISRFLEAPLPRDIRWLSEAPDGGFGADGLPFAHRDRSFIAYEAMNERTGKGVIAVREVDREGGPVGTPKVVLESRHHMSYPFVMAWEDALYMLPECSASGRLDLYRMGDDPWTWDHAGSLFDDVPAIDPTIVEHDGKLWMFYGRSDAGSNDALFLASSSSLLGPWHHHAANPVKVDAGSARCAGPVFSVEGQLYRPGQDCADRYGARVVLHRIETLDDNAYQETPLACPAPDPSWRSSEGMHTMAVLGDEVLVDACRERPVPPGVLFRRLLSRAARHRRRAG